MAYASSRVATAVNAPHVVAVVRAGAAFKNGKLVERPGRATRVQDEAA
jgi:hypothetical protein